MLNAHVTLDPVEVLYIATLLLDRHRPIDGYIDYFGSGPAAPGAARRSAVCRPPATG